MRSRFSTYNDKVKSEADFSSILFTKKDKLNKLSLAAEMEQSVNIYNNVESLFNEMQNKIIKLNDIIAEKNEFLEKI